MFTRKKDEYYVVCQKKHVRDCRYAKGKTSIPLVTKRIINKEINDIKSKGNPIKYVHLGGTEILIKTCFREGIDTPIELYLEDDRIIKPIEKSIITAVIDYNDYSYRDIDIEENLKIVNDKISTTKRIANEKPESSSSSKKQVMKQIQ